MSYMVVCVLLVIVMGEVFCCVCSGEVMVMLIGGFDVL